MWSVSNALLIALHGHVLALHCHACIVTLPCVLCYIVMCVALHCQMRRVTLLRLLCCVILCVVLHCHAMCLVVHCHAMCLVLHSSELCANRFSLLGLYRVWWHFLISNSLWICNPCNFLTYFLAIQVLQRIVEHTPEVQRSAATSHLCEVSLLVISNLHDSTLVINPDIWFYFFQDIGNESLNRSAEMMEIDARLNALQKFMKENMPWYRDALALHLSHIITSGVIENDNWIRLSLVV